MATPDGPPVKIPIAKTVFTEQDFANVVKPLQSGWVVQGPFVQEFERKWSEFTGAPHAVAVSNCTTALQLSLAALGLGPGDEVVVPAFTWVATANAVESLGARPVFCDIQPDTFNMDPASLHSALTERTRAIIPVHLFGLPACLDEILEIAFQHNLRVIEDAACGFAARFRGVHVGNAGDTGCFSFHPRKAITTGEGGMVITGDAELAARLRAMRDHGATATDLQRHLGARPYLLPEFPYLGYNYRMTDIQASIGCTQMDRAREIHSARVYWAGRYHDLLRDIPWLQSPSCPPESVHGFQAYVCVFEAHDLDAPPGMDNVTGVQRRRNDFMDYLQNQGVSTRPGTHAVHMLQYYRDKYSLRPLDFPQAFLADHCTIAFPLFPTMTEEEFEHIARSIRGYQH